MYSKIYSKGHSIGSRYCTLAFSVDFVFMELSTVSMRLIYGSCRNKVLFSYLYLS